MMILWSRDFYCFVLGCDLRKIILWGEIWNYLLEWVVDFNENNYYQFQL